jgi:hypothetical protein
MDISPSSGWHKWTLLVGRGEVGYLLLPRRTVTSAEWERIVRCLECFRDGLVDDAEIHTPEAS